MMAGNLGRHYYKKPIAALTFDHINLRLCIFADLVPRYGDVLIEHGSDVCRAKLI